MIIYDLVAAIGGTREAAIAGEPWSARYAAVAV
jgi:hypothetical protein